MLHKQQKKNLIKFFNFQNLLAFKEQILNSHIKQNRCDLKEIKKI